MLKGIPKAGDYVAACSMLCVISESYNFSLIIILLRGD